MASKNKIILSDKIILFTPIFGISTKPDKKVPTILPKVEKADKFPETLPMFSLLASFKRMAYGEIVANKKLGMANTSKLHKIATIPKFGIRSASFFTTLTSNNGIILVKRADSKII